MRRNQKGFTIVEILLAIIAVTLIAGVVFYVFNANKKTDQSNSNQTKVGNDVASTKSDNSGDTKQTKDLAVPDLGIKLTLSGALSDLKFTSKSELGGTTVDFTSDSFDAMIKECKANATTPYTIATVVSYAGTYDANAEPNNVYMEFIKQLKDSYLEFGSPDGGVGCADQSKSEAVDKKYTELKEALKNLVKNSEEIKN